MRMRTRASKSRWIQYASRMTHPRSLNALVAGISVPISRPTAEGSWSPILKRNSVVRTVRPVSLVPRPMSVHEDMKSRSPAAP
jgi:hypothetical protein